MVNLIYFIKRVYYPIPRVSLNILNILKQVIMQTPPPQPIKTIFFWKLIDSQNVNIVVSG